MGMLMEELAEELAWEMARELARELLRGLMRELAGCRHKCWQISLWGSCLGSWPGFLRGNWRRSWWGCWRKLVLLRLDMVQKSEKSYQFLNQISLTSHATRPIAVSRMLRAISDGRNDGPTD